MLHDSCWFTVDITIFPHQETQFTQLQDSSKGNSRWSAFCASKYACSVVIALLGTCRTTSPSRHHHTTPPRVVPVSVNTRQARGEVKEVNRLLIACYSRSAQGKECIRVQTLLGVACHSFRRSRATSPTRPPPPRGPEAEPVGGAAAVAAIVKTSDEIR